MNNNNYTGRIVINDGEMNEPYNLFENGGSKTNFGDSMKSIQDDTELSQLFFSRKNIEFLHQQIINQVYHSSNKKHVIGKQNETQLQIIMRSIFLQHAKHLNCKIKEQISELNKQVIIFCVDKIIIEINQYLGYREDVSKNPVPLEQPKNLSNKGNKILSPNIGFNKF
jgi:hypothetical protein